MRLDAAIDAFRAYLAVERGLADATIAAYLRDLGRLREEVGDVEVARLDARALRLHLARLEGRGLTPGSRARALSAISGLLAHLRAEHQLEGDPMAELERPRRVPRAPRLLGIEQVAALIEAPDATPLGVRDRALLELLYAAGLRVSELVALKVPALDLDARTCRVVGPGGRVREAPFGEPAADWLERYLVEVRPGWVAPGRCDALFVSRRGLPLSRQAVWYRIRHHAGSAGLDPGSITPHVLRHSCASHLLRGGADVQSVQQLLGHADLGSTAVYTQTGREALRGLVERHPRGGQAR